MLAPMLNIREDYFDRIGHSGIMGCAIPVGMTVSPDVWLLSFFRSRPVVVVDRDRVWLRGSAGSMLELVRAP
jgi:hypothetical protein